jgi:hypothetical protein
VVRKGGKVNGGHKLRDGPKRSSPLVGLVSLAMVCVTVVAVVYIVWAGC